MSAYDCDIHGEGERCGECGSCEECDRCVLPTAIGDVLAERHRQDEQWGGAAHDDTHTIHDWASFLTRHGSRVLWDALKVRTGEAPLEEDEQPTPEMLRAARHRLVVVAALAVAAIDSIDRRAKGGAA